MYYALREVRHTILRLIGDHYRVPRGTHRSWQGCNLDLTGITIDGNMSFEDATFSGGRVSFNGATFSGGRVDFGRATFSGGRVSFNDATFSGGRVDFGVARFSARRVSFYRAIFSGSELDFEGASGPVPPGLYVATRASVPRTVTVPLGWMTDPQN
ncbi:pentapeptide repeat-containing protein [Streptomyces rochei]|uniref:pentapeptide repeat-containing protein n=1 Tax=Streptomyces rochei TaxID=1928 RepID=UPI0036B0915C